MKYQPLVSIIMNCYNGEEYLDESLKSIINQSYQNWELIFWDNLSTDNSKKIFEFEKKIPRGQIDSQEYARILNISGVFQEYVHGGNKKYIHKICICTICSVNNNCYN